MRKPTEVLVLARHIKEQPVARALCVYLLTVTDVPECLRPA